MKSRISFFVILVALTLMCVSAWSDQIVLKDGRAYSGKFVRADAEVVEFRVLNRVESFKTADVAQIVFREPEMQAPVAGRSLSSTPETGSTSRPNPPAERELKAQPPGTPPPPRYDGSGAVEFSAGTGVLIRMEEAVDTDRNRVGDTFRASLEEPLSVNGSIIVPRGSAVKGRIAYAKESGRLSGQSELILELTELSVNGKIYPVSTSDYTETGASRGKRTAATVGGVAAVGAVVGAIAGGGKGAAIGAATGAAVGTGVTVLTRGQVLHIPVETILEFKLQKPLDIDAP